MSNNFRLLGEGQSSDGGVLGSDAVKTFQSEFDNYCKLSKKQRMYGFGICFVAGWVITVCSLFALPGLALGKPAAFAICYTCGNIVSLCATGFLFGPVSQLKSMFKPIRAGATVCYFAAMIFTLVIAFTTEIGALVLLGMAIQFVAMVWYAASYIPYGRTMIKKMIGGVCKSVNSES